MYASVCESYCLLGGDGLFEIILKSKCATSVIINECKYESLFLNYPLH